MRSTLGSAKSSETWVLRPLYAVANTPWPENQTRRILVIPTCFTKRHEGLLDSPNSILCLSASLRSIIACRRYALHQQVGKSDEATLSTLVEMLYDFCWSSKLNAT